MNKPNLLLRRSYRLIILSDEHCAHISGLTHPDFQGKFINDDVIKHNKITQIQRDLWKFFDTEITNLQREKPIDILLNNGDFLDGSGERSGGTELLSTDRFFQIQMCKKVVETVKAKHVTIVAGTPYHCGQSEDWEQVLANDLKCKFESHAWLDINKVVFDCKHHCGSSSIPHGRFTAISRDAIWAKLWAEANLIPQKINYLIRSHVHYFSMIDDGAMVAMTTPSLQMFGSKYGARKCTGIPTIGFLSFDINPNGSVIFRKHLANLSSQVAKPTLFQ
jgi:hypothetical protein